MATKKFDFAVLGSGFAGSIMSLALNQCGYRVCLIEKDHHPRFAIGESSTPIADMILRRLAEKYKLPFLENISRYGTWQETHPDILCGIKRGFSYYRHKSGQAFDTDYNNSNQLLVAASSDDYDSDTHWYRADVDSFLVEKVMENGIDYMDRTEVVNVIQNDNHGLNFEVRSNGKTSHIQCNWLIDATGSSKFASEFFDIHESSSHFQTQSKALYSHFQNVVPWTDYLKNERQASVQNYPFNADHSALHHLIDEGWMWNLRFNNGLVSAGFMIDLSTHETSFTPENPEGIWKYLISRYPSIRSCYKNAHISPLPGDFTVTGRLQRQLDKVFSGRWIALNHTAGFIDPLHSTGIAHTLTGVERLLDIFCNIDDRDDNIDQHLSLHQSSLSDEFYLIDLLVAGCYLARDYFDLFHAFTMVYFACTVSYEQSRLKGMIPETYLNSGDPAIRKLVEESWQDLSELIDQEPGQVEIDSYVERARKRIQPFNTVGLLDPDKKNMYRHTAVSLR
jgi:tetracycline 7-halogenase / FADH2 O2-dependent halogenase